MTTQQRDDSTRSGQTTAVRLIFAYEGTDIRPFSSQRIEKTPPPGGPLGARRDADGQGLWVEVRDAERQPLYRRGLRDPVPQDVEAFSHAPERPFIRVPLERPRGAFAVVVPDIEEADHAALLSGAPGLGQAATATVTEVARFPLRPETGHLAAALGAADGRVVGTTKIVDSGPSSSRWNLVIMGDGYQENQLRGFAEDAERVVAALFATPPFDELRDTINVYMVEVISTDSGAADACNPSRTPPRTYFDATFCVDGIPQTLLVDEGLALTVAGQQVPGWDAVLIAVNHGSLDGGTATESLGTFSLFGNFPDVALHELGHLGFGLADEYDCSIAYSDRDRDKPLPQTEPSEPNATLDANRGTNKWRDLIAPDTPLPTAVNQDCASCAPQHNPVSPGTVGAFMGGHTHYCGVYRPQWTCMMRTLGDPYCAVCQRRIRHTLEPYRHIDVNRVATVSRASGNLDVFWANTDGRVWTHWWNRDSGGGWYEHQRFPTRQNRRESAAHDTAIAAVARTSGHLDLFWAGSDGRIWSHWWDHGSGKGWYNHDPFPIALEFTTPPDPTDAISPTPGGGIAAVARTSGHLDVFWVGTDGRVWGNWWDEESGGSWYDHRAFPLVRGYLSLAAQRSGLAAVARTSGHLDVFWVGVDGAIWSNWYDQIDGMGWYDHDAFPIALEWPVKAVADTRIAAVARTSGHLDVFWVGADGAIWSTWYDQNDGGSWYEHQPFPIAPEWPVKAAADTGIAAVAQNPRHLDVFWAGDDGAVWSTWWDQESGQNWYDHKTFSLWGMDQRANTLRVQAAELSAAGRHTEAVEVQQQARAAYQDLTEQSESFRRSLAQTLVMLGVYLARAKRFDEAVEAGRQGVAEYRTAQDAEQVAWALGNLAGVHDQAGRFAEAVETQREAADAYRALAAERPAFRSLLAKTLVFLSNYLLHARRAADAVPAANEAVAGFRELADRPNLAWALGNLAATLQAAGRPGEGADAWGEARTIYQELAGTDPAYRPLLAQSAYRHAALLVAAGHRAEAREPAEQAVTLYRELADAHPGRYVTELEAAVKLRDSLAS
ncbi:M64 family metallopeptidase [Streptomyces sp. NPDC050161]|uniref:M64 family metallopeptidase n=1 Tax=Streptomyces sp. NPDC050161 TaxID=3365604 RepID=UPI0037953376